MIRLLRFPGSVKRDPAIDDWMREHAGELGAIAQRWFAVMRDCADDVRELLHDGHLTACIGDAAFAYVNAFTAHVNVGFFRGAELADPDGLLEGTGKFMRHVKLRPKRDVDPRALIKLIATAYADMKQRLTRGASAGTGRDTRLPPGQALTRKWPVLSYGGTPHVDLESWTFRCFGLLENERSWTWQQFLDLPRVEATSDIHCVTRWSRFDNRWEGVATSEILRLVSPRPEAVAVLVHAEQGYTANVALSDLHRDGVVLALKHDGRDLPPDHGGPCRLVVPHLYFWKSAKWVRAFEFLDSNPPGFWEQNGYHLLADPWKEERYSDQETDAMQRMRAAAARRRRYEERDR